MNLSFLYAALKIPFKGMDIPINNFVIDSREVKAGDVFVAIRGDKRDGHDFAAAAWAQGAVAVVAERSVTGGRLLLVKDTVAALGRVAMNWRQKINPYVIGITGSNGKTTVKTLTSLVLRENFGAEAVLATAGNLNNHLGVPLTLLRLTPAHRFAVIEMGMNHSGEIAYLTRIARPQTALVNNVLRAHIGCGFRDLAAVAAAKGEIFQGLTAAGLAVLPRDSSQFALLHQLSLGHRLATFARARRADFTAGVIRENLSGSVFKVKTPQGAVTVNLPLPGRHNIANALATLAVLADIKDLTLSGITRALAKAALPPGRLTPYVFKYGLLLDDTYNANPDSMTAAIDILAAHPGRRLLVMGDMAELGINSAKMHGEIGSYARDKGIDYLLAVGEESRNAAAAFGAGGEFYADKTKLGSRLHSLLQADCAVLVKGSRCMHMEDICADLVKLT